MEWRVANCLLELRAEVNAKWPNRSKDSDGTIGDASHASRSSDHNPWIADPPGPNVVSGMDITHDPASGCDSYALAQWLLDHRDPRIKYVISNRRIAAGDAGPSPWVWRPYHGTNPHNHHCHISVKSDKSHYDSKAPWGISNSTMPIHDIPQPTPTTETLRLHSTGDKVRELQTKLGIKADGTFGFVTQSAVEDFQKLHGLHADGIVGPQTWEALERK